MLKTAILIDGGFFHKRFKTIWKDKEDATAIEKADLMYSMALSHLTQRIGGVEIQAELYRIFYYDCLPFAKKMQNPVTGKSIDFAKTAMAVERNEFLQELRKKRKVALRLGELGSSKNWIINPTKTKDLISGKITINDITEKDVKLDLTQKGVDMKIGIDICSLAIKKMVNQIILVAGDSDFVPAAKTARTHIDGLRSKCPKPKNWG